VLPPRKLASQVLSVINTCTEPPLKCYLYILSFSCIITPVYSFLFLRVKAVRWYLCLCETVDSAIILRFSGRLFAFAFAFASATVSCNRTLQDYSDSGPVSVSCTYVALFKVIVTVAVSCTYIALFKVIVTVALSPLVVLTSHSSRLKWQVALSPLVVVTSHSSRLLWQWPSLR
jgi:hypothetical protein